MVVFEEVNELINVFMNFGSFVDRDWQSMASAICFAGFFVLVSIYIAAYLKVYSVVRSDDDEAKDDYLHKLKCGEGIPFKVIYYSVLIFMSITYFIIMDLVTAYACLSASILAMDTLVSSAMATLSDDSNEKSLTWHLIQVPFQPQ